MTISFTTFAIVLGYILLFTKPTYESDSQILLEIGQGFDYNPSLPTQGQIRPRKTTKLEREIALSIEILNSEALVGKVVDRLGPANIYEGLEVDVNEKRYAQALPGADTTADILQIRKVTIRKVTRELLKHLNVSAIDSSPIIDVSFQHENPFTASDVVNSLVSFYVDFHLQIRKKPQLFKFFQEQYEVMQSRLDSSEKELRDFKEKHAIPTSIEEEYKIYTNRLAQNQLSYDAAINEKFEVENGIELIKKRLSTIYDPALVDKYVKDMFMLRAKETELIKKHGFDHSSVKSIRAQIENKRANYSKLVDRKRFGQKNPSEDEISFQQDLEKELLDKNIILNAKQQQISNHMEQINVSKTRLKELDTLKSKFIFLKERRETDRKNFALYQTKLEEFRIFDALDKQKIASVKVLQQAHPAVEPLPSKRRLLLLLALFFGVVGGVVFVLASEHLSGVLNTRQDVELHLRRPLLGSIPDITTNRSKNNIT